MMSARPVLLCWTLLLAGGARYAQSDTPTLELRGTTLVCGSFALKFAANGDVTVYENGKRSEWSTNAEGVDFDRNAVIITPGGAQDNLIVFLRFGRYSLLHERTECTQKK